MANIINGINCDSSSTKSGTDYCILDNGLKISWGKASITTDTAGSSLYAYTGTLDITFPVAYKSAPAVSVTMLDNAAYWNATSRGVVATYFTAMVAGNTNGAKKEVSWIAIGY